MITAGEGTLFHKKVFSLQSKVSNLAYHTRVSGPIRQLKSYSVSKKRNNQFKLKLLVFVTTRKLLCSYFSNKFHSKV